MVGRSGESGRIYSVSNVGPKTGEKEKDLQNFRDRLRAGPGS